MEIANIWAVGRNYSEHAKELGNEVPSDPLIFLKAGSSAAFEKDKIRLPGFSKDVNHEVELAFLFDSQLKLSQVGLAIDLTARDIQSQLKAKGMPWTLAKSFKQSCLLSHDWVAITESEIAGLSFTLHVNGELRQTGHAKDMVFKPYALAKYVTDRFPVLPGDILLTGTPQGVAKLSPGDLLKAQINGKTEAKWQIEKD